MGIHGIVVATGKGAGAILVGDLGVEAVGIHEGTEGVAFADSGVVVDVDEVSVSTDFSEVGVEAEIKKMELAFEVAQRWSGKGIVGVCPKDALDAVGINVGKGEVVV